MVFESRAQETNYIRLHRFSLASLGISLCTFLVALSESTGWFSTKHLIPGSVTYQALGWMVLGLGMGSMTLAIIALIKEGRQGGTVVFACASMFVLLLCFMRQAV